MAHWTWETVSQRYSQLALARPDTPYGKFAQGMLNLIPKLQSGIEFANIRLGMATHTLTIGFVDKRRTVYIDWEKDNLYSVYLNHAKPEFFGEETKTSEENVVVIVNNYLRLVYLESEEK